MRTIENSPVSNEQDHEFYKIVASFGATALRSTGLELEEIVDISPDAVTNLCESVDQDILVGIETDYDNRFMRAQQEEFLKNRAYHDDCGFEG